MNTQPAFRSRAPRGFTLTELMVVLAVAGVMLLLVAPRFGQMLNVIRSRSAVDRLASDLALARVQAIRQGRTASLRITGPQTYTVTLDEGAAPVRTLKTVDLGSDYKGVAVTPSNIRIAFDSRGLLRSDSTTIRVRRGTRTDSVRISLVGRVQRAN